MIAIDTNILVYAHRRDVQWHVPARDAVRRLAEGTAPWAIPWPCIHEFLGIVTHPKIYSPKSSMDEGIAQLEAWLESPTLHLIGESAGYWPLLRSTLMSAQVAGPKIHDGRIAAICQLHGVQTLWSADRDFSRFPDLEVRNPLRLS